MKIIPYDQKKKISEGMRKAHAEKRKRGFRWNG